MGMLNPMANLTDRDRTPGMRFGTYYFFQTPPRLSHEEVVHRELEQFAWTEKLGYDALWLTEHHFIEYGLAVDPATLAAVAAARTPCEDETRPHAITLDHLGSIACSSGSMPPGLGTGVIENQRAGQDASHLSIVGSELVMAWPYYPCLSCGPVAAVGTAREGINSAGDAWRSPATVGITQKESVYGPRTFILATTSACRGD